MRTLLERLRWWGAGQTIADEVADTIERQAALLKLAKEALLVIPLSGSMLGTKAETKRVEALAAIEEYEREST